MSPLAAAGRAPDPAVQSIQTAMVLTDQLAMLATTTYERADDAELRIGQAQSLVPEIWNHLDAARGQLATRGVDVGAYDHVRRGQPASMLAVTDVHTSVASTSYTSAFTGGGTRKAAQFDPDVCNRARAGCKALIAAMPEVDWAQLARADAELALKAQSLGAGPATRAIFAIVITLVVIGAVVLLRAL